MPLKCAICGHPRTHGAHIKGRKTFIQTPGKKRVDDREKNIIRLCPNHHYEFDQLHTIGIIPDRSGFIIEDGDDCRIIKSCMDLANLDDGYIAEKNGLCTFMVRFRLGMIQGNLHGKMW